MDSGAADTVMPKAVLEKVEFSPARIGVRFSGPNGQQCVYYDRCHVNFVHVNFWEAEFGSTFHGLA